MSPDAFAGPDCPEGHVRTESVPAHRRCTAPEALGRHPPESDTGVRQAVGSHSEQRILDRGSEVSFAPSVRPGREVPGRPNARIALVQSVAEGLTEIQKQYAVPASLMTQPETLIDQSLSGLIPAPILKSLFAQLSNSQDRRRDESGEAL